MTRSSMVGTRGAFVPPSPRRSFSERDRERRNLPMATSRPPRRCWPIPISASPQIAHCLGVSPATLYRYIPPRESRIPRSLRTAHTVLVS
jgi:hypothetical protein